MLSVLQCLRDVANYVKGVADYPVESVVNADGFGYTKWNSGKLEQWGESYIPASYGNASIVVTFPKPFVDIKYRTFITGTGNFTGYALTENYWGNGNRDATTTGTRISVFKRDGNENYNVWFSWYTIGRWK